MAAKHISPPYSVDAVMSDYPLDICLAYDVPSEGCPIVIASVYGDEEDDGGLMNVKAGKATAAFIVTACNAHDEAMSLIEVFRNIAKSMPPPTLGGWNWPSLVQQADDLISKVSRR